MKEQRVEIVIDSEGRITADAHGFSGDACLGELEKLLKDLVAGRASLERKPDSQGGRVLNQTTQRVGKRL
jgi:hypothetical protein